MADCSHSFAGRGTLQSTGEWGEGKGRVVLPNLMKVQKNSNRPSTAPSNSENYVAIFSDRYGCIYARNYDDQIV